MTEEGGRGRVERSATGDVERSGTGGAKRSATGAAEGSGTGGAERFSTGDTVRTAGFDPPHHCRLPAYARSAVGTVVQALGRHPLPDDRARGLPAEPEPVYTVRFQARDLFGGGGHAVTVDVWESHLSAAGTETVR